MIHIQYKGKGLLVLIYLSVPFFAILISSGFILPYFFGNKTPDGVLGLLLSLSLSISGLWNYLTVDEYYTDENGEKQYVYFDNRFMYLEMKLWSYIFWAMAGLLLVFSVIELIPGLKKYLG